MRVILLGKERYRDRPGFTRFLDGAGERGHIARLIDRDTFLATNLDDVDVILAKSHYKDDAVVHRLRTTSARVVNNPDATAICESRLSVASRLDASGVPTPPFLKLKIGVPCCRYG